jgi:hypothetical protein
LPYATRHVCGSLAPFAGQQSSRAPVEYLDPPQLLPRTCSTLSRICTVPTAHCTTSCRCIPSNLQVIFCMASRSNPIIALDTNCKNLALRDDKPPANLHIAEQRLDLPRREVALITDDNRDTIFGNEVQLKPTSLGHDYGRSSPNRNTGRSVIPAIRRLPLRACRYVVMVTTADPLSYL